MVEEEEGDVFGVEMETASIEKLRESAKESGMLPQGFVTEEMDAKMKQLPEISLLENPEVEEEAVEAPATEQPSLMAQPEGQ
jgi:hypothetical protein